MPTNAPQVPATSVRRTVAILSGLVLGLLVGVVISGAAWVMTFGAALSGSAGFSIPLIAQTEQVGNDIVATSGPGILLIPVAMMLIGGLVGAFVGRKRRLIPQP